MKLTLYIALVLLSTLNFAQSGKFSKAILKGKEMIAQSDSIDNYIAAANYFERIKLKETNEWLPSYYHALALTFGALKLEADEKEDMLNTALKSVEVGKKIAKNSELIALEGFIQMLRLSIDPAVRGRTLSPTIFQLFNAALKYDENNPRATLFLGQMHYGTAQFFGSSTEEACSYFEKAKALYDSESPEDTIFPTWGKKGLEEMVKNCNE
ncbi:MAG: hypothetical protein JXR03_13450 [Cyclobacteriaceae bacterium]